MRIYKTEHTTADELNFLKKIGFHSGHGDLKRHIQLLNNYRNAVEAREIWKGIKKEVILDFVDKKIKELKKQEVKI